MGAGLGFCEEFTDVLEQWLQRRCLKESFAAAGSWLELLYGLKPLTRTLEHMRKEVAGSDPRRMGRRIGGLPEGTRCGISLFPGAGRFIDRSRIPIQMWFNFARRHPGWFPDPRHRASHGRVSLVSLGTGVTTNILCRLSPRLHQLST